MASKTTKHYRKNKASLNKKRAYNRAYAARPDQIKNRSRRVRARRKALKKGIVKKGDGMDLHHVNGINSDKVVKMSASRNRAINEKSRKKGYKRKKRKV